MIVRRQKPRVYNDYKSYKRYLRIDFDSRCAYCGITEYRWGSDRNFVVEHFRPRRWFKHLETAYANLYWACNRCNDIKSDTWPTPEEEQLGYGWVDPCSPDVKGGHWIELSDGNLDPRTRQGEYTVEGLWLNLRSYLVRWRKERRDLLDDIDATLKTVERLHRAALSSMARSDADDLIRLLDLHRRLCERLRLEY